jgi:hypothetical protein
MASTLILERRFWTIRENQIVSSFTIETLTGRHAFSSASVSVALIPGASTCNTHGAVLSSGKSALDHAVGVRALCVIPRLVSTCKMLSRSSG